MKVTIDTQSDSIDDIKKLLHILTDVLERKGQGAITTNNNLDSTNLMSMFSEEPQAQPEQREIPDTAPNFSSFLNLTKKKDSRDEDARIEFY